MPSKQIKSSPKNPQAAQLQQQTAILQYSSPLPPPEVLEKYGKLNNSLIEKIIELTEIQGNHRRQLEADQVAANIRHLEEQNAHIERRDLEAKLGQFFGFLIAVTAICAGAYVAIHGAPASGGIISIAGLGSIVGAFIYGRKETARARKGK